MKVTPKHKEKITKLWKQAYNAYYNVVPALYKKIEELSQVIDIDRDAIYAIIKKYEEEVVQKKASLEIYLHDIKEQEKEDDYNASKSVNQVIDFFEESLDHKLGNPFEGLMPDDKII